jgi:cell division protein FtsZ
VIGRTVDPEARIIFGAVLDRDLDEELRITLIATGFRANARVEPDRTRGHMRLVELPKRHEAQTHPDYDIPAFLRQARSQ